jgi:predicted membrane protein
MNKLMKNESKQSLWTLLIIGTVATFSILFLNVFFKVIGIIIVIMVLIILYPIRRSEKNGRKEDKKKKNRRDHIKDVN